MITGKTPIVLTLQTFVGKVISLLFNTWSRFVTAFLPRSKHLLILSNRSWENMGPSCPKAWRSAPMLNLPCAFPQEGSFGHLTRSTELIWKAARFHLLPCGCFYAVIKAVIDQVQRWLADLKINPAKRWSGKDLLSLHFTELKLRVVYLKQTPFSLHQQSFSGTHLILLFHLNSRAMLGTCTSQSGITSTALSPMPSAAGWKAPWMESLGAEIRADLWQRILRKNLNSKC